MSAASRFFSRIRLANRSVDAALDEPLLAAYRHVQPKGVLKIGLYVLLSVFCLVYGYYFFVTFPYMVVPLTIPLAGVIGLAIWALPDGSYAPKGWLKPLLFAFTATLFLWPNYLAIAIPGLPWLTLLRLLGLPMTLVLVVCVSSSEHFRRRIADVLAVAPAAWKIFLVFIGIQLFSIAFSSQTGASISKFIIAQTNWTAIFFVSCYAFSFPRTAQIWAWLVWLIAIILCGIGIWEMRLGHVPWAGHIPSFLQVDDPAVRRTLAGASRAAVGVHRVAATTTHPLVFAEFLGLVVPFAIHFTMQRYPLYLRVAAGASIPLLFYIVLLTDSRLGLGASLLSIIAYVFFWAMLRWSQNRRSLLGPAVVLAYPLIFSAFMAATVVVGRLRSEVWGNGSTQASTESRGEQWASGLAKLKSHPFGYGIGRGGETLGFTNAAGTLTIDTYYLSLLLEYGYLGFLAYFSVFITVIWTAGKAGVSRHTSGELLLLVPLTISLVNFVVVKSVLSAEANHPFVFMMLGAALALTWRVQKLQAADGPSQMLVSEPATEPNRLASSAR